jgi:hypothetical protein
MAGLHVPLPTLRRHPRGCLRTARGRCESLILHRSGLAPPTPCRPPGARVEKGHFLKNGFVIKIIFYLKQLFKNLAISKNGLKTPKTDFFNRIDRYLTAKPTYKSTANTH